MKHIKHISLQVPPRAPLAIFLLVIAFLLAGLAGPVAQAQAPAQIKPVQLDADLGESCQDLRLAGTGQDRLVVAWVAPMGTDQGIYLQTRLNLLWNPAIRLIDPEDYDSAQPRDLDITFDYEGRLHLVWTALAEGRRKVFIARVDDVAHPQSALQVRTVPADASQGDQASGDADFPALTPDGDGGMVAVWQESRLLCFSIHAARIKADGALVDLGLVSGKSLSGLSPQVLDPDALQVAWCEVQDVGMSLRVDQWRPDELRWAPSALERQLRGFDHRDDQALLYPTDLGLVGCWTGEPGTDRSEDGTTTPTGGLELGWLPRIETDIPGDEADEPLYERLGKGGRDVAHAGLSGRLGRRLTVAWQEFAEGRQRIRLASAFQPGEDATQPLVVSGIDERFATLPDHLTIGDWSAVVWTDDYRDGGRGGVYFAEIHWPGSRSR